MSDNESTGNSRVGQAFGQTLNRHGYGFQYSVLNLAEDLSRSRQSVWCFEAAEFPVEIQGHGTRIDFVLSRRENYPFDGSRLLLLAECKRANPALANWCFAQAPYVIRDQQLSGAVLERAQLDESNRMHAFASRHYVSVKPYHIGVEVRSEAKGESTGSVRGVIEDAATQASRGLNGMIQFLRRNIHLFGNQKRIDLLPVVFTTANLWVSDVDLRTADLHTGNIDLADSAFSQTQWLAFDYQLSPGIKHSSLPEDRLNSLGKIVERDFMRTIFIVSASGVAEFLDWSGALDLR